MRTNDRPSDWNAQILGKQPTTNPKKIAIALDVTNSSGAQADIHFVYALFKKTALTDETMTAVTETDQGGHKHTFRRVKNPGSANTTHYPVAAWDSKTVTDLVIDLSDSQITGYVFLDVFVVNTTEGNSIALPRFPVYP